MAYLVLARRWRPQRFEEVIGQRHVTRTLQNAISTDRVAHAFLFSGARGVGKTTVARILAKALNCKGGPSPQPCGQCDSCREITEGISLDVLEIDGASNTGVDDVRELREGLRYPPAKGHFRIYIIDEVHMLSNAAFNALLKSLEEPPAHVVFIFATTEPHKIPVTILSRCQRFDFKRIPLGEIVSHLQRINSAEGIDAAAGSLALIAREAQGSLRDAQSLLDQVISYAGARITEEQVQEVLGILDRQWLFRTSDALLRRDGAGCLQVVMELFQHGFSLTYFHQQLVEHLRNLLVVQVDPKPEGVLQLPDHEIAQLREQAQKVSSEDLQLWFDALVGAEAEIRRSAYPRYLLEMLLVKLALVDRTEDLDALLTRITSVRQRLGAAPEGGAPETQENASWRTAPSSGGGNREFSERSWAAFLEHVRRQRPSLASILEQGRVLDCSERGKIRLSFPTAFHVERVSAGEQAQALGSLSQAFFGHAVQLSPVLAPQNVVCRENHVKHQMQVGVKAHPLVQEALQLFGGRIVEIRIPEEEASAQQKGPPAK